MVIDKSRCEKEGSLNLLSENDFFRFELLSKENLEGAVQCVSRAFTMNEPMSKQLGITVEEFLVFARLCYSEIINDGLSLVAIHRATERVVGVRISEDFCRVPQEDYDGISPKFIPLFAILDTLSNRYREIRQVVPGKFAHMFMVGVEPEFANQGLAPRMYRHFIKLAMEKGYTYAVTEPTGTISQHVLRNKFGFDVLDEIFYEDFVFEGAKPFEEIEDHQSAQLMEKLLAEINV